MSKSPGHQRHPDHRIVESPAPGRMTVELDSSVLADSRDVVRMDEDGHPARWYFARDDVRTEHLKRSGTRTTCPFKGQASYYDLHLPDRVVKDLVWSYEDPYDEHAGLKGRLAFDVDRAADLVIRALP